MRRGGGGSTTRIKNCSVNDAGKSESRAGVVNAVSLIRQSHVIS